MKITKTQLKRIIKEELVQEKRNMVKRNLAIGTYKIKTVLDKRVPDMDSVKRLVNALDKYIEDLPEELPDDNTMTEGFGLEQFPDESDVPDEPVDPLYAANDQGIVAAQDDFMRHQRGEGVSPDLPSFGSAEEEEAYGKAWGKEWHRLMDNAVKNRVDMERKLNRPPEPETDADREAAEAEFDFEATYSEGKTKITKSKLAQIVKEELKVVQEEHELQEGMLDNLLGWFSSEAKRKRKLQAEHDKYVQSHVDLNQRNPESHSTFAKTPKEVKAWASANWQKENGFPWGKFTDALDAWPGMRNWEEEAKENVAAVVKRVKDTEGVKKSEIPAAKAATGELFDPDSQLNPKSTTFDADNAQSWARAQVRARRPDKFDWNKPGIPLKKGESWSLEENNETN
jgi:hypothetical protein